MKRIKIFAMVLALTVLLVVLASCQQQEVSTPNTQTDYSSINDMTVEEFEAKYREAEAAREDEQNIGGPWTMEKMQELTEAIVGTWYNSAYDITYAFTADGKVTSTNSSGSLTGTYKIWAGDVEMRIQRDSGTAQVDWNVYIENGDLVVRADGQTVRFVRK